MKKILVEKYKCDFCNETFDDEKSAEHHEKMTHMCPYCENHFLLYGSESICTAHTCNFKRISEKEK